MNAERRRQRGGAEIELDTVNNDVEQGQVSSGGTNQPESQTATGAETSNSDDASRGHS